MGRELKLFCCRRNGAALLLISSERSSMPCAWAAMAGWSMDMSKIISSTLFSKCSTGHEQKPLGVFGDALYVYRASSLRIFNVARLING